MERDPGTFSSDQAASALAWWAEAGVDTIVGEAPRDWLRPPRPAAQDRRPVPAPDGAAAAPAAAPVLPDELGAFREWLLSAPALPFAAPSAPRVGPSGDPAAGLMILVDMPSLEDLRSGILLSGAAGRLFDRMLAAIGRDRASVYLAPMSPLRAPAGTLDADALAALLPVVRHHVALAAPRALLLFGDRCAQALLGGGVAQSRGRVHALAAADRPIHALATISPDLLLKSPAMKALAWADLQLLLEGRSS